MRWLGRSGLRLGGLGIAVAVLATQRDGDAAPASIVATALEAVWPATLPIEAPAAPWKRWGSEMDGFAASDRQHMPDPGGTVFIGSSSISLWADLEHQFPGRNVVRRGLGGARLSDCVHLIDRLVLPYRPSLVVVYAGDNDLALGATPQTVLKRYVDLVRVLRAGLPEVHIAFVSIKPSPARRALMPAMRQANALIASYSRSDPALAFIDIYDRMLDHSGQPRAELFEPDALHPSPAGYALWREAIAPLLR